MTLLEVLTWYLLKYGSDGVIPLDHDDEVINGGINNGTELPRYAWHELDRMGYIKWIDRGQLKLTQKAIDYIKENEHGLE